MAIKLSKSFASAMMDGTTGSTTGSAAAQINGLMKLFIYKGTVPATASTAIGSATLMVTVSNAGAEINMDDPAVDGVLSKDPGETWDDNGAGVGGGGGVATFYRLMLTADDGATDTGDGTRPRVQGTIGTGNADMLLGNTTLVASDPFTVPTFTLSLLPT